jgi:hypothetical protein
VFLIDAFGVHVRPCPNLAFLCFDLDECSLEQRIIRLESIETLDPVQRLKAKKYIVEPIEFTKHSVLF